MPLQHTFLLGIDRNHRLASRLEGHDLLVDMFELSITVGVMASFLGLAIDLAAVVEAFEQLGDTARRNLMPHAAQRCCEFRMALGYPHEQPHGVAECRRFKQPLKILQKRRIGLRERRASTARTTNLLLRKIKRYQVLQAAIDRAPRYSRGPRHGAHAAVSGRPSLGRRKQAPFTLIKT